MLSFLCRLPPPPLCPAHPLLQRWDQCIFLPFSQCSLEEVLGAVAEAPYANQVDPSRW